MSLPGLREYAKSVYSALPEVNWTFIAEKEDSIGFEVDETTWLVFSDKAVIIITDVPIEGHPEVDKFMAAYVEHYRHLVGDGFDYDLIIVAQVPS